MSYRVMESDLIGDLKGFPIEVVERIVEYQVYQGNKADVSVFSEDLTRDKACGGFDWEDTKEGFVFWESVIDYKNFDLFFERYPKAKKDETIKETLYEKVCKALEGMDVEIKQVYNGVHVSERLGVDGVLRWLDNQNADEARKAAEMIRESIRSKM